MTRLWRLFVKGSTNTTYLAWDEKYLLLRTTGKTPGSMSSPLPGGAGRLQTQCQNEAYICARIYLPTDVHGTVWRVTSLDCHVGYKPYNVSTPSAGGN